MRLVDLTRPLEPVNADSFPGVLKPLLRIIAPEITYIDHAQGARIMKQLFGCSDSDLPAGEGWAEEEVKLCSHAGTHVDAPWHYGSTCQGKPARTVDQIELSELYCDGVVIDMTSKRATGDAITTDDIKARLQEISYTIKPGDAVLIRTDHDKYELTDPSRYNYPGMIGESAAWLAEQGARVGGTDATGWDRPFHVMIADFLKTRDRAKIWDAHFAHRQREFFVVQQLTNLHLLPPHGFKVGFFPIKLAGASAAPARVVAFIDSE